MNTNAVDITKGQYLKLRRACRITGRGPRSGYSAQYEIPGHKSPFSITNYSYQTSAEAKAKPYYLLYDMDDKTMDMLVRNITEK